MDLNELKEKWLKVFGDYQDRSEFPPYIQITDNSTEAFSTSLEDMKNNEILLNIEKDAKFILKITDKTTEMINTAIDSDPMIIEVLKDHQNNENCMRAVKLNGLSVFGIKDELHTKELCLEAVKENPMAFEFCKYRDEEINLEAVKQDPELLHKIEDPSEAVQLEAIKQNYLLIDIIDHPSTEVKLEAIRNNFLALQLMELCDEINEKAIDYNPYSIAFLDQNKENCLKALEKQPLSFKYIKNFDDEIVDKAIELNPENISYVGIPSKEIILKAVKLDGLVLRFIGFKQDPEICLEAVKQNGLTLQHVIVQTPEICLEAVNNNENAINFIQKEIILSI